MYVITNICFFLHSLSQVLHSCSFFIYLCSCSRTTTNDEHIGLFEYIRFMYAFNDDDDKNTKEKSGST